MKANEIKVGCLYTAKVSGKMTTVRVDAVRETYAFGRTEWDSNARKCYDVTNLATGRKTTFRSAAKFRGVAESPEQRRVRLEAVLAEQDAKMLAMSEAAGLTPETPQHMIDSDGYVPNPDTPLSGGRCRCRCLPCRIVRAMQRRAARATNAEVTS